jgi:hypothetical protein
VQLLLCAVCTAAYRLRVPSTCSVSGERYSRYSNLTLVAALGARGPCSLSSPLALAAELAACANDSG